MTSREKVLKLDPTAWMHPDTGFIWSGGQGLCKNYLGDDWDDAASKLPPGIVGYLSEDKKPIQPLSETQLWGSPAGETASEPLCPECRGTRLDPREDSIERMLVCGNRFHAVPEPVPTEGAADAPESKTWFICGAWTVREQGPIVNFARPYIRAQYVYRCDLKDGHAGQHVDSVLGTNWDGNTPEQEAKQRATQPAPEAAAAPLEHRLARALAEFEGGLYEFEGGLTPSQIKALTAYLVGFIHEVSRPEAAAAEQCADMWSGKRCAKTAGHDGLHAFNGKQWASDDQLSAAPIAPAAEKGDSE